MEKLSSEEYRLYYRAPDEIGTAVVSDLYHYGGKTSYNCGPVLYCVVNREPIFAN